VAALYTTPISDPITLWEAVNLLADTPFPVSESQLQHLVKAAGLDREMRGRAYRYSATEILELHRDKVAGPVPV
jgi:hypothetical protein